MPHPSRIERPSPTPRPLPQPGEARRRVLPAARVLPPPGWLGTWHPADKHAVVRAIMQGQVRISRVRVDYMLSLEELCDWFERYRFGPAMSPMMAEYRILLAEMHPWLTRGV